MSKGGFGIMRMKNLVRCSQISVDCMANDPMDIRLGGPEYLGFDFLLKKTKQRKCEDLS